MAQRAGAAHHEDARTQTVAAAGASFVYRQLGPRSVVPLVVLQHLGANLDNGDPRILDGLARDRGVVSLGYRGVGGSTGRVSASIEEMAADAVAVIRALGRHRVDLLGQSMGGMVAQAVAAEAPELIDRLILSSAGPAGGPGLGKMTGVTIATTLRAVATFKDPKTLLFFNRTPAGKSAAREYLKRLKERTIGRDRPVTPGIVRAQLAAVHRWALRTPLDVSGFTGPVLIIHGGEDRLVPVANATALARHLPAATVTVYPTAGHGVVFQHHAEFVAAARDFLRR